MEYVEYFIYFKNGKEHLFLVELGEKGTYNYDFQIKIAKTNRQNLSTAISNKLEGELELESTIGIVKIRISEVQMIIINGLD